MSVAELLAQTSMHTQKRKAACDFFLKYPEKIQELVNLAAGSKGHIKIMAFAILDQIGDDNIALLQPYLESFCQLFPTANHQSTLRCSSRIAMNCLIRQRSHPDFMSRQEIDKFIEMCFDWIIAPNKVATKVNAMYGLSAMANASPGISEMLVPLIEKDFAAGSPGYKAAVRKILKQAGNHLSKI